MKPDHVTKTDLAEAMASMELRLGAELKRHVSAMTEHLADLMRAANDESRAFRERLERHERRFDEHVADGSAHKRPRRARR
jgi:hypothetical protein